MCFVKNKNEKITLVYYSCDKSDKSAFFEIKKLRNRLRVCVSLKNSNYQYITYFKDIKNAIKYVECREDDYYS